MMNQRPTEEKAERQPQYEGDAGKTRLTAIHVTVPEGFVRSVRVYTSVNVTSDPELREAALSGALHRFDGGEELAIPFVFHDPGARKYALVLPEALRHEELRERARLLTRLADDTENPIPPYVRRARVVIGLTELRQYLADDTLTVRSAASVQMEEELRIGAEGLAEREQRLHARAEAITRREDEARELNERLEQTRLELGRREQQLARQEKEIKELKTAAVETAEAHIDADVTRIAPMISELSDDDVESIDDISELEVVGDDAVIEMTTTPGQEGADEIADEDVMDAADFEEIVDDGDFEVLDSETADSVVELQDRSGVSRTDSIDAPTLPFTLPADFLSGKAELVCDLQDRVWLFARLGAGEGERLTGELDLLAQWKVIDDFPTVLLTLVDGTDETFVRRAALNPKDRAVKDVLDSLRTDFSASVAVFDHEGKHQRNLTVEAPRRVNVAMILERASRHKAKSKLSATEAKAKALSKPPPVSDPSHPFVVAGPKLSSAKEAHLKVQELGEWTTPEKLDHALLTLSVPRDLVDESQRELLSQAAEYGIALPPQLLSRAVSVGVAPEPGELVTHQLAAFFTVSQTSDRGGLTPQSVADNWKQLLEAADENDVLIESEIFELASAQVAEVEGESAEPVDVGTLPELEKPQLVMLLGQPQVRKEAALELCRRGSTELADTLMTAARRMSRAEVVRVVPRIADLGDDAGDALIDGLSARKTFVRQAAALGLAHLNLRRAVVPLVHLLQTEESEVWREIARVVGTFGTGAFRAVSRALRDSKAEKKRLALALAHLAINGCEKQVEGLSGSDNRGLALVALEGLNLRQSAKDQEARARGDRPVPEDDKITAFSRRYKEELEGVAPVTDLVD